jgi:PPOX class probable F420-dependent enzyme
MRLPDGLVDRLLDRWPIARLATVRADGSAHVLPVVFARLGDTLWTPIDGKPKSSDEPARIAHVRAHPRVSVLLDDYSADWERLWWLRVDGDARVVERADPSAIAALRRKYPEYGRVPVLRDPPLLIAIELRSRASWAASESAISAAERESRTLAGDKGET